MRNIHLHKCSYFSIFWLINSIKNDYYYADLQAYNGKGDTSFLDWITKVEKIARLTQCPEIQLTLEKAEGKVYKLFDDMPPSSMWDAVKKDYVKYLVKWNKSACSYLNPFQTPDSTWNISRECPTIHQFGNAWNRYRVKYCHVTIILFTRHFDKDIKKHIAGTKSIQTLRHAMILAQEVEIKLKSVIDNDPSVMKGSAVPHLKALTVQGQCSQHANNLDSNQIKDLNVSRLNWKVNLTFYKCGEKGHLG